MGLKENQGYPSMFTDEPSDQFEEMLYARHVEITSEADLQVQRGTAIPALFNQFYKFIQNPSSVSVETFKRMVDTDDTVGSGVDFLTTALSARLGAYQHPNKEVTEFISRALDKIEGGFQNTVKELLSATWAGFAVQEKVWGDDDIGFLVKKMVSLPPTTMLFETERTGELTHDGILQYQRNYNPFLLGRGLSFYGGLYNVGVGFNADSSSPDIFARFGDMPFPLRTANTFNYLSIRIPKTKCVHYAFDAQGKFGNPYGRSLLRRAYKYYVLKDAILQMMAIAMDRKGTNLMVVYVDPNTQLEDANRNPTGANPKGQRVKGIRADVAARDAFKNVHNESVIFLPGKKGEIFEVDPVNQTSNASDFIQALDFCNKSIMRALLLPSLIFTNGDGTGSYSLGQEHAKTFDKICDGINAGLERVLIQQLVRDLIIMNFPESAYEKEGFGGFGKRELTVEEIDKEITVIEKAVNIGAIDMNELSDLNQIREKIGFERRTDTIEREPFMFPDRKIEDGETGQDGDVEPKV